MPRNYTSKRVVYGQAFLDTVATAFKTDPGAALVVAGKVRLTEAVAFNPQPSMTLASLVADETAFSGYTPGGYTVTLGTLVNMAPDVRGWIQNVLPTMATASPLVPGLITGWWIDDGVNVVCAEAFANDQTFGFATVGDFLDLLVALPFTPFVSTGM